MPKNVYATNLPWRSYLGVLASWRSTRFCGAREVRVIQPAERFGAVAEAVDRGADAVEHAGQRLHSGVFFS